MDGGILSQDEINALLMGMSTDPEPEASSATPAPTSSDPASAVFDAELSDVEKDAIGEVANISMGTSATTLFSLVNRKVNITTPVVSLSNWADISKDQEAPCVFIEIKYTVGLDGSNILILKEDDVKVITDLMMGGDGTNVGDELSELHLSAISEAMNQMMGSSATSLSQMLGKMIDISPPVADLVNIGLGETPKGGAANFLSGTFVKIAFRMQIGDDLVDSTILQLYPVDFAKELVDTFLGGAISTGSDEAPAAAEAPAPAPAPAPSPAPAPAPMPEMQPQMAPPMPEMQPQMGYDPNMYQMPPQGMPMYQMPPMQPQMPMYQMPPMGGMNYQQAQFENFSGNLGALASNENIDLIMDVPLEVTVELGRTKKSIAEILDFSPGTIIELERIAGEPIDVLVNGKFVAKGEVVVIEESFGIRVTEIIK